MKMTFKSKQLCLWAFYNLFKRKVYLTVSCTLMCVIFYRWCFKCDESETRKLVEQLCINYFNGEVTGNLCHDLCRPGGLSYLSCYSSEQGKGSLFSGVWKKKNVVFKSIKISRNMTYPNRAHVSDETFLKMIKGITKLKFNIIINNTDAKRMSHISHNLNLNRHTEVNNLWSLLQDKEYLALMLFEKVGIFPKLLGSCGSVYAEEQLNSISNIWQLLNLYDTKNEWKKRVNISIMIMDLLLHLDNDLEEPMLICMVKMNHFGITDDLKKVVYMDLDFVFPVTVANKKTGDGSICKQHSDCDYLDCRSFCNLVTFKCQYGVVNNNLQVVCEKIFLGWVVAGKVTVPGLLLGPQTPRALLEVLELCANPDSEPGTPRAPATKEVRKRLYNLLLYLKK